MPVSHSRKEHDGNIRRAPTAARRSLDATLSGLAHGLADAVGADTAAIYLVDPAEGDLVLRAGWRLPPQASGHRVAIGEGLSGIVAAEARSVVSRDATVDPRALRKRPDWETRPAVRGVLAVPLRAGANVLGVVELTSASPDAFDPETRGRASVLADAAALLVERSLLLEEPPPAALEGGSGSRDPIGIATVNPRGLLTSASPTFCHMVAQPVEAIVGRPAVTILPALGRPGPSDALEAAWHGAPGHVGRVTLESLARGRGEAVVASLSLIPVGDPARGVDGVMLALHDVSAHARLEAELRAQTVRAVEARDRLRAVVEVVSHELRTPLTSVLGFARLLEESPDAERERRGRWAAQVIEKARLMARLVDEVTELARLGAVGFSLEPAWLDAGELANEVAMEVMTAARRAEGDESRVQDGDQPSREAPSPITVDVAPGLPRLRADRDRVAQVLRNLLENALKYGGSEGPVRITVYAATDRGQLTGPGELRHTNDQANYRGPRIVFEVSDRGPGVAAAHREAIFEPFYRAPEFAGATSGTGLGLAVCRGIVEAHGGRITLEEGDGGGATFRFWLPASGSYE